MAYQLSQTSTLGAAGSPGRPSSPGRRPITQRRRTATPAGGTATVRSQNAIGDFTGLNRVVGGNRDGSIKTGWGGALGNFATLYGIIPNQTGGAPSAADLASICTKQTDIQTYAETKGSKLSRAIA